MIMVRNQRMNFVKVFEFFPFPQALAVLPENSTGGYAVGNGEQIVSLA